MQTFTRRLFKVTDASVFQQVTLGVLICLQLFGPVAYAVPLNVNGNTAASKQEFANKSNNKVNNSSLVQVELPNSIHRTGCRYKATLYASGDNVPTDESCLFCHCKGSVVICKLRVCPEVPDPPPPGCIVVQKANKCCSQLVCNDNHIRKLSREQRLSSPNETLPSSALETLDKSNYCVHDGTVYAEGSAMRSSTLCEHCFCIHGKMKCSSPQCLIPLNGCKPRYRSYACCPTNYDCNQSNETAILKTIPSSTPVPQFLKGCTVDGRYVTEGEPVLPMQLARNSTGINRCQTCFCMGGVVHCRPLACDRPIEGCRPVIEDGHCCPDRYECDEAQKTTVTSIGDIEIGTEPENYSENVPTTTVKTSAISNNIGTPATKYPKLFQKVPLIRARKDDDAEWTTASLLPESKPTVASSTTNKLPITTPSDSLGSKQVPLKRARISYTSVGGFKNQGPDAGSRERRRKKDRVEYLSRSFYDDDAREDSSVSFENSGQSEEQASVFFDEKSDGSASSSDGDDESINPDTESTVVTELNDVKKEQVTEESLIEQETLAAVNVAQDEETEITQVPSTSTKTNSTRPLTQQTSQSISNSPKLQGNNFQLQQSTNSPPPIAGAETTIGNLEFISFGVEDAVFSPMNETRYEIYPGKATSVPIPNYETVARKSNLLPPAPLKNFLELKPLEPLKPLKLQAPEVLDTDINSSKMEEPVPIIVEQSVVEDLPNAIMDVPVQTSLYNNGYYGQGLIVDDGKDEELVISQAEIGDNGPTSTTETKQTPGFHGHIMDEEISLNTGVGEVIPETINNKMVPILEERSSTTKSPSTTPTPRPFIPLPPSHLNSAVFIHKKLEQPLTAINSNQKFIPSFLPIIPKLNETDQNPARTYSKFGVQDSSYYRYGHPGSSNGFVPSSPGENDTKFFIPTGSGVTHVPSVDQMKRKVPTFKEDPKSRLRYNPYQPFDAFPGLGYEDPEESEEFGSYESYLNPTLQTTAASQLRHRYGVPFSGPTGTGATGGSSSVAAYNPVPLVSSGGTKVSLSTSKDKTTRKPGMMGTKIVNSKPLRRPKPVDDQHLDSPNPLGFKPVVAFPFSIPKSQDNFNLGLKLSGCNIYGKMYGVGQVIHELSSICVQCRCTEVGVQCSELQC